MTPGGDRRARPTTRRPRARGGGRRRARTSTAPGRGRRGPLRRVLREEPRPAPSSAARAGTTSPSAWRTGRGSRVLRARRAGTGASAAPRSRRRAPRRRCRPAADEALEHPRLVVLRLQAPDEPRAGVRHRLVVEVDGVLGRQHEPQPERAALLEDRQDRLLGRRRGRRRHVAEHLVHVRERAQVGGARPARASR